ncbi:unnamed protein product [Orchesella dallaii]|uniref:C2H2-type domain-containing protein n=1 Tax=Orchesella dallaii TaxID=48710 RepID=A0ABP1R6R2_9HEXA
MMFRRKGELKKHEKKVHEDGDKNNDENTKSHLCSRCGKVYSNPVGLAAHLAIVHKEKNEVEEGGRAGGGAKRKVHECPHCEEKFGWKYVLDRHLLKAHPGLEIGEGMLECNVCGLRMASGQKSRMDYHKSTHLTMEERRREGMLHMCHHCGKEFRTRWSYKGHLKMHEKRKESEVKEGDNRPK